MSISVQISRIAVGHRHRQEMGDLEALAANIAEQGLLQPIGLTEDYELVFGERRLRACRDVLHWAEIPARIVNVTSILEGEWSENELRKDFTISERVAILQSLERHRHGGDREQVCPGKLDRNEAAKKVGFGSYDTAHRAEYIIDRAPQDVVEAVDQGLPIRVVHETLKRAEAEGAGITSLEQLRGIMKSVVREAYPDPPADPQEVRHQQPRPRSHASIDTFAAVKTICRHAENYPLTELIPQIDKWTRRLVLDDLPAAIRHLTALEQSLREASQ